MDFGALQSYLSDPYGMLLVGSVALLIVAVGIRTLRKDRPVAAPDGTDMRWWRADRQYVTQYDVM